MTARELYKKNLPLIEAWVNGAVIEGRLMTALEPKWVHDCAPLWDDQNREWRVKLEPRPLIHFALFPGAQAICGSQQWAKGGDGIGTEWSSTTCAACLAKKPKAAQVHYMVSINHPICGEELTRDRGFGGTTAWSEVTCAACLTRKPEAPKVVHFLAGQYAEGDPSKTQCGKPWTFPCRWEPGHSWSGDWADVTCPECLKRRPMAEIQPPEGYRLLRDDEPLLPLDMGHWPPQNSWITVSERATAFDAFARKVPEGWGGQGQPITAASDPTSREDLVRQRNWAVAESKRLKADLAVCQAELEALWRLYTVMEATVKHLRP